jgi:hypothetical protein
MDRRQFIALGAAAGASSILPSWAQEKSQAAPEVTDEQVKAINKGLDWLARNQGRSGAVGTTCQVAFTGLAGLAWLAGGNTPTRGKYAVNVKNALKFIMRCTPKSGYINEAAGRGMGGSGMHGHGYALLFLAELAGMCAGIDDDAISDEQLKDKIAAAVKCTEGSQDPSGGWYYEPNPGGHEGSVTVTQVEALRAARNIGISVSKTVIDKGIGYIKKSTCADGTIMYSLGQGGRAGSYALTAAGACVYAMYGLYEAPEAKKCMKALMGFVKQGANGGGWDSYANFYAGQACFFMKSNDMAFWTEGYPKVRKNILASQDKGSGGWNQDQYGGAYGTACACLVLQIPYRFLPIFQD